MIRHARNEEKTELIKTLDEAFFDVRASDFSIAKSQPRAYEKEKNRAEEHLVIEKEGKMVSVLGNLQETLTFGERVYPFATIGSVATLPSYRHQGLMRSLMEKAHQENEEKGDVFAILTGNPDVYDSLGFVPGPVHLLLSFGPLPLLHQDYSLRSMEREDLAFAYALYCSSASGRIRQENTFLSALQSHASKAVMIYRDSKQIGYVSFNSRYGNEIRLTDMAELEGVLPLFPSSLEWVVHTKDFAFLRLAYKKGASLRLWQREMLHIYRPDAFLSLLHENNETVLSRDKMAKEEAMHSGHFDSNAFVHSLFPSLQKSDVTLSSFAYSFEIPWCDLF